MISLPFRALCIDDRDRPGDIPTSKWVKKGNFYTVISMEKMNMQSGQIGFELEELDLSDCFPYTRFAAWRFAIPTDQFSEEKVKREEPETIDIL